MTSACINDNETEFVHSLSKKTRSNQNILMESLKICKEQLEQQNNHLQPQPATPTNGTPNKRHSLSTLFHRGKQPQSRASIQPEKKIKLDEKKGYFERRKERKLKKIEQKPVYKWNYKSLYTWLKYKGFDKKYIRQLKKDRLNGYIMLTLEISDLVSIDIPSDMAKNILNSLIEVSEKQDSLVDVTCECGEVELPLQPVRSTMVFTND